MKSSTQFLRNIFLTLLAGTSITGISQAAERTGGNLHVSGGIAMPATSTAVLTNPAGVVGAPTSLVLQAGAPEVWSNGTYRAGVQTGDASWGAAVGAEHRDRGSNGLNNSINNNNSDDPTLIYYGVAVGVPAFSLGVGGKTGVVNSSGSTFNAGAMFLVGSSARIGLTARDLEDGVNEWGLGVGFNLSAGVDLVIDAAANEDLDNAEVKPGIKVGNEAVALTLSYATGPRQQFADDFTAGVAFQLASASLLELQYNAGGDLSKYYACFTLGF